VAALPPDLPTVVEPDTGVAQVAVLMIRTYTPLVAVVESDGQETRMVGAITAAQLMEHFASLTASPSPSASVKHWSIWCVGRASPSTSGVCFGRDGRGVVGVPEADRVQHCGPGGAVRSQRGDEGVRLARDDLCGCTGAAVDVAEQLPVRRRHPSAATERRQR
jgi:hypothetical protein